MILKITDLEKTLILNMLDSWSGASSENQRIITRLRKKLEEINLSKCCKSDIIGNYYMKGKALAIVRFCKECKKEVLK